MVVVISKCSKGSANKSGSSSSGYGCCSINCNINRNVLVALIALVVSWSINISTQGTSGSSCGSRNRGSGCINSNSNAIAQIVTVLDLLVVETIVVPSY